MSLEKSRWSTGVVARSERQGFLVRKGLGSGSRVLVRVWRWKGLQEWSWKVQDSRAWRVFRVLWVMVLGNLAFVFSGDLGF